MDAQQLMSLFAHIRGEKEQGLGWHYPLLPGRHPDHLLRGR